MHAIYKNDTLEIVSLLDTDKYNINVEAVAEGFDNVSFVELSERYVMPRFGVIRIKIDLSNNTVVPLD